MNKIIMESSALLILLAITFQLGSSRLTQNQAHRQLKSAGILIPNLCDAKRRTNCTSFEGIRESAIDGTVDLKNRSKCSIEVTGGKENPDNDTGYFIFIRNNDCIFKFVTSHNKCKRFSNSTTELIACEFDQRNMYSLQDNQWEIFFHPKEDTFLSMLTRLFVGWNSTMIG